MTILMAREGGFVDANCSEWLVNSCGIGFTYSSEGCVADARLFCVICPAERQFNE